MAAATSVKHLTDMPRFGNLTNIATPFDRALRAVGHFVIGDKHHPLWVGDGPIAQAVQLFVGGFHKTIVHDDPLRFRVNHLAGRHMLALASAGQNFLGGRHRGCGGHGFSI